MRRVEAAYLDFGKCSAEESAATSDLATEAGHLLCADKYLRLVTKEEADALLLDWKEQDKERLKNGNDILQTLTSAEHDVPALPKWFQMAMRDAERNAREQYQKATVKDLAKLVKRTLRARVDDAKERWDDARKETLASYERYEELASAAMAQTLGQVETKEQLVRRFEKANYGKKPRTVARLAQVPSAVDFKPYYKKRDFDFGPYYRMPDDSDTENTTSEVEEALRRPPCACDQMVAATEFLTAPPAATNQEALSAEPAASKISLNVGTISTITNKSDESNKSTSSKNTDKKSPIKSTSSKKKDKVPGPESLSVGRDMVEIVDAGVEGRRDIQGEAGRPDAERLPEKSTQAEVPPPPPAASNEDALTAEPAAAKGCLNVGTIPTILNKTGKSSKSPVTKKKDNKSPTKSTCSKKMDKESPDITNKSNKSTSSKKTKKNSPDKANKSVSTTKIGEKMCSKSSKSSKSTQNGIICCMTCCSKKKKNKSSKSSNTGSENPKVSKKPKLPPVYPNEAHDNMFQQTKQFPEEDDNGGSDPMMRA
ncbi:unnamed protein product, partial [Mesorhabditis spiculigera]